MRRIEAYRYALRFRQDGGDSGEETGPRYMQRLREGVLVCIAHGNGRRSWGDVAPLPGHSRESLAEASTSLMAACKAAGSFGLPVSPDDLRRLDWPVGTPPSVHFGLETAMASASASSDGVRLATWLRPHASAAIPVNALLTRQTDLAETATNRLAEGFLVFKLKVGSRNIREDVRRVRLCRRVIGPSAELRLDANRAYTFEEALEFLGSVQSDGISYIEEPLADAGRLPELADLTDFPIAVDESITEAMDGRVDFASLAFASAAVIKPSLVGGLLSSINLSDRFAGIGVETVFSSLFESTIGVHAVASLAAAVGSAGRAAGLDTLRYFSNSVLKETSPASGPTFRLHSRSREFTVDTASLEKLF